MAPRKEVPKEPDFEMRMSRLQAVVEKLETPDIPLEESVALYKEGCELVKCCREQLEKVRNEVRLLSEDGSLIPFFAEEDASRDET